MTQALPPKYSTEYGAPTYSTTANLVNKTGKTQKHKVIKSYDHGFNYVNKHFRLLE